MSPSNFPVLWQGDRSRVARLRELGCPKSVPWEFVARHHEWCLRNHDQTPERLAERGGLSPCEMVAVVEHRRWRPMPDSGVPRLLELLALYATGGAK